MLRTRWYKVVKDLWSNRARTLVVALAIAVGVYSVGVIVDVQELLIREDLRDREQAQLSTAVVTTMPFDEDLADRMAEISGVVSAEGRHVIRTYASNEAGERRDLHITAVPDFAAMQVDITPLLDGRWPDNRGEIVLERLAMPYIDAEIGDTIALELENGVGKELTVVGIVHDVQYLNPDVTNVASGYVTFDTMSRLGFSPLATELRLRTEETTDKAVIQTVLDDVEDQIERSGRPIFASRITNERPQDPFISTVVLILSLFGVIILLLSGFLVVNAISALITQQIQQIGIMKLIGASRWQIMSLYFVTVIVYGLIAIAIGIPLAWLTARFLMTDLVADLLNIQPDSLLVSPHWIVLQIAIGLLLPLLAGLAPVLNGTRITTQKALNSTGMDANVKRYGISERLIRWLQSVRSVQRPLLLAIRNTLRHKGRLAQTLIVLIIGTALFISVLSVRQSVNETLVNFLAYHQYDVSLSLARPYRIERLEQTTRQLPGVVDVESWSVSYGSRVYPDDTTSDGFQITALPPESDLVDPQMEGGEWLSSAVVNGIVINSDVADDEPDLSVGDVMRLRVNGRDVDAPIVGITRTDSQGPAIYMTASDYAYLTRTPGQANRLLIISDQHDSEAQFALKELLFGELEEAGFEVSGSRTQQQLNDQNNLMFTLIVAFLVLMALLLAAVGGLGLTTTMSINILERIREIGVLRAVGASNASIRQIVLAEGIVIGLLSWGIGTLLSFPISAFLSEQVGLALLKVPLIYTYSFGATAVWFFALLLIATAASLGPARNAVRLTIREVLAYE